MTRSRKETERTQPTPASPPSSPPSSAPPSYTPVYQPDPPKITYSQQTLIACEYCGTPMAISAHFCPNCGAKRGTPST